ncbi:MAG: FliM/FliN family flagellar motor switch protein, partial [Planctomycetota bacterium]
MSDTTQENEIETTDVEQEDTDQSAADSPEPHDEADAQAPEFNELESKESVAVGSGADLNRLNDVQVIVSAELGRAKVSIHELLQLGEGSVFELNRSVDGPVELVAQGVPLGNGDVVVVDGNFAIRIQEIYRS